MIGAPHISRVMTGASSLWRGQLARQAIWLAGPFGLQQLIRLASSVVLARLLAPEMFGVMVLINTLRTGTEMLSDIGIGQSVVRSPHATDREFLDTAFTVQLVRGMMLCGLGLLAAWPIAHAYGNADLFPIISLVSVGFLTTGLLSPDLFMMQRDMRLVQRAIWDLTTTIGSSLVTIALAMIWGNVWALVWGLVLGSVFSMLMTYAFQPLRLPRLAWKPSYVSEILNFGKWIFLSTAIFFASVSTDKIYFSAVLPLAMVGVYGVARTFADMLSALAQRFGQMLVFPKVVELRQRGAVAVGFRRKRRLAMTGIAVAMAFSLAGSDQLVLTLYDRRYHEAAFMLPVLLVSVWFAVLAAFGEATLFGLDRPQASAVGNAAKFAVMIVGLPLLVPSYGILAGLLVLFVGEVARWLALSIALQRERLASIGEDLILTLLLAPTALALKATAGALGLVPTIAQWWALGATLHG